jgi:hypothetical protein
MVREITTIISMKYLILQVILIVPIRICLYKFILFYSKYQWVYLVRSLKDMGSRMLIKSEISD